MHGYHFPILNHIRHREKIDLPYYLFTSLSTSVSKGVTPLLHQGLIYALYKFVFDHCTQHDCLLTLCRHSELKYETPRSFVRIELIETNPLLSNEKTLSQRLKVKRLDK